MKKSNVVLYVVIGVLAIAFIGGIFGLSDEETSLSATNVINNTISMNSYKNSYMTNEATENMVKKEVLNEKKTETLSKEESLDTKKSSNTSSNVKESTSKKETNSTSKTSTNSSKKTNSKAPVTSNSDKNDKTSQTVWVGNTGTKYHRQSCRTLKGKGHKITLKEALAEGREPCKVCKP